MKLSTKLFISALIAASLATANPAFAASGGRISSGGFRSSSSSFSRSSPSRSFSSGTPRSTYRAPEIPRSRDNDFDYRPRRNGGGGSIIVVPDFSPPVIYAPPAPVIVPAPQAAPVPAPISVPASKPEQPSQKQAKGGGNSVWLWLLAAGATGVFAYLLFRNSSPQGNEGRYGTAYSQYGGGSGVTVTRQNVALLASAKDVKEDLERLAERGDTDSDEGLAKILQETTLALLRHPEKVVYAYGETSQGRASDMESLYNRLSMEERSKVSEELLSNVSGFVNKGLPHSVQGSEDTGEYILVSLIVAVDGKLNLKPSDTANNLHHNLVELGSIQPESLAALEIIWQPEGDKEVLTQEDLLSLYPNLSRL